MNIEYFIAKKLFSAKEKNNSYIKPIFRIAILAISLSVAIMLISVMILSGFKQEISSKVIGFGSHITISNFTNNNSYETEPISINQDLYTTISGIDGVKNINVFATKAAIIKTVDEIHAVVLKGVSTDYDWNFFNNNLVAGEVLTIDDNIKSNDVLISKEVANILQLDVSDDLVMYFIQNPARVRKFNIKGIYNTSMVDFDKLYVLGDIKHIQQLNLWNDTLIGGFEIAINNFNNLDVITKRLYEQIPYDLNAQSIKEKMPHIFDWLNLQDVNVRLILILMLIVGSINMITSLLILIFERTRLIGVLKALGANNWSIRKIFLYSATNLLLKGLILGNLIAFSFALLQKEISLIDLDPATYYMNTVPISFDFLNILILNIGTVILCYLILILPTIIITKITPIKAIRFE